MNSLEVEYAPSFVRLYDNLEHELQREAKEKIALFRDRTNHRLLKVHKLKGYLKNRFSFSVNYRYRIVFRYQTKSVAELLAIGDHDIYK